MATRHAARFLATRAHTLGLYILAIIGGSSWDRGPDSWRFIALHLISAAAFLWWAVNRTIRHYLDDQDHDDQAGA